MIENRRPPHPVGDAAAGALGSRGSDTKRQNIPADKQEQGRAKRPATFAVWCRTEAPHQLSLDDELVVWLCRVMAAPEMRGITNLEELNKALRLRRTKLRFPNELAWHRLVLTAKTLWLARGGKL